jgi:hypothetical protein
MEAAEAPITCLRVSFFIVFSNIMVVYKKFM